MPRSQSQPQTEDSDFPIWRRPLQSLPTRISFFVLGSTLCTSLAVIAISVSSIDGVLRKQVEEKFSTALSSTSEELRIWYAQRAVELEELSNHPELRAHVAKFGSEETSDQTPLASQSLLEILRDRTSESRAIDALFLLEPGGGIAKWVGKEATLLPKSILERIRQSPGSNTSPIDWADQERIQIASSDIPGSDLTLHALLHLREIDRLLAHPDLGRSAHVYLVGPDGRTQASSRGTLEAGRFPTAQRPAGVPSEIRESTSPDGSRIVRSSMRQDRFGWTLFVEEDVAEAFAPVASAIRRLLGINLAIVSLFGVIAYRVAVVMIGPIEALAEAARRISLGEMNVHIPNSNARDEMGLLTRAFNEMTRRLSAKARELEATHHEIENANTRLRTQNDELQHMNDLLAKLSITDGLTQLHNHRYFQDFLAKETKRADRTHEPLSLILVDIDHFKRWNDRLGHAGGDEILRRIAEVMNTLIRGTDLLARYGGEEFALVAPGTDLEGAVRLAEKMRTTIAETQFFLAPPSEEEHITVSMGVAIYRGKRKVLFNDADGALYRAKATGRDCVMVADPNEANSDDA